MTTTILQHCMKWCDIMHPADARYGIHYLEQKKRRLFNDLSDAFGPDWHEDVVDTNLEWYKRAILKEMRLIDQVRDRLKRRA